MNISHICTLIVCFGLLVSPPTIPFSGMLMRDNIEDVFVTRVKKGDFVTKSSLNCKTNIQYVENCINGCSNKLVVFTHSDSRQ